MHGVDGSSPKLTPSSTCPRNRSLGEIDVDPKLASCSSSSSSASFISSIHDASQATSLDAGSFALDVTGDPRPLDVDAGCQDRDTGVEVSTKSELTILDSTKNTVQYYEDLKKQLIQKQKTDLKSMMKEQEKQQLLFQRQIIEMLPSLLDPTSSISSAIEQVKTSSTPTMHHGFKYLYSYIKGHLVRKLFKSDRVQKVVKTIRDTAEFAIEFQCESPIKRGVYTNTDVNLQGRILNQLTASLYDFYAIFFEMSTADQMTIIRQSDLLVYEKSLRSNERAVKRKSITHATEKVIARKEKMKNVVLSNISTTDISAK